MVGEIVLIEVKIGKTTTLIDVENSVKRAIEGGRVGFIAINVKGELEKAIASA